MKSLSIYTLTRNQSIEHISKLERQLSGRKFPLKIRTWESGEYESIGSSVGNVYAGSIFPPIFSILSKFQDWEKSLIFFRLRTIIS